ncbi:hypothetical protein HK105_200658 [Polyrhizophydium stewartii]|uniref:Uncharacterized protein n=1 Tax=Polyrhizophydium stewartii TaxID=2732419 RepID=A0ABR4NJN3_9FUNG
MSAHAPQNPLVDSIIAKMLAHRCVSDVPADAEAERRKRMYTMLRHSQRFRRMQVAEANLAWRTALGDPAGDGGRLRQCNGAAVAEPGTMASTHGLAARDGDSGDVDSRCRRLDDMLSAAACEIDIPSALADSDCDDANWDAGTQEQRPVACGFEQHSGRLNADSHISTQSSDSGEQLCDAAAALSLADSDPSRTTRPATRTRPETPKSSTPPRRVSFAKQLVTLSVSSASFESDLTDTSASTCVGEDATCASREAFEHEAVVSQQSSGGIHTHGCSG